MFGIFTFNDGHFLITRQASQPGGVFDTIIAQSQGLHDTFQGTLHT